MAEPNRINGDLEVSGTTRLMGAVTMPSGTIVNATVSGSAAIGSEKLEHRFSPCFGQANAAATAETKIIHLARGAGVVLAFSVGAIAAATGDSTVTVDLQKRTGGGAWASLLNATVSFAAADTVGPKAGSLVADPSYAADDQLRIVQTVSAGTGTLPTGMYASAEIREAA